MNVLVLNLTRLGDLLQSQATVAGLTAQGHSVALVCLDNFSGAARLMRGLSAVFELSGARLLAGLDQDWRKALAEHHALVSRIQAEFPPDVVINLTPTAPARLLAMTLGARSTLGFAMDDHGFNADTSLWAAFLQLASKSRCASPFNIVDMFRRIAGQDGAPVEDVGLRGPSDEDKAEALRRMLEHCPVPPDKGFVALQPGASAEVRRWPLENLAHVARGLIQAGYTPVVLGSRTERPLSEELLGHLGGDSAKVLNLVGATDLPGLAAVLANCRLLVTNDTGTMHLAAGLGVRSVAIFLAMAQPWDTGPYLPGCICLEPDMPCQPCAFGTVCPHGHACRGSIQAAGVLALALAMLEGGELPGSAPGARVWQSVLGPAGLMDLKCLSGHENEDRTRWIRLQRDIYRPYLDGQPLPEGTRKPGEGAALSEAAQAALSAPLAECAQLLELLQRQGELLAQNPLPPMKTKFLATWQRIRAVLESDPRLALTAALWTFEAERPGLGLPEILALARRFAALLGLMHSCVRSGMAVA